MTKREFLDIVFALAPNEANKIMDAFDEYVESSEPHWIPVTERLPDEDQPVLVTDGAVMWVCSLIRTDDGYKWENNMGYWHDFDEWEAWKSLPEPYKGVTNGRD